MALQAGVHHLQPARPAEPAFAADLVRQPEHQRALGRIGGQAAAGAGARRSASSRISAQPLRGRVVVVDGHRAAALAGPLLQRLAVVAEPHRGPRDALDVQDAFGASPHGLGTPPTTTMRSPLRSMASSTLAYSNGIGSSMRLQPLRRDDRPALVVAPAAGDLEVARRVAFLAKPQASTSAIERALPVGCWPRAGAA
jgi:hypothetical protein